MYQRPLQQLQQENRGNGCIKINDSLRFERYMYITHTRSTPNSVHSTHYTYSQFLKSSVWLSLDTFYI